MPVQGESRVSRREGSCVVVAESMFADTPVAILEGVVLGSRAFVNRKDRAVPSGRPAGAQLLDFIEHAEDYQPRAWAEEQISCFRSTEVLNAQLKEAASETEKTGRSIWPLSAIGLIRVGK